mgnify:CR=1 FL=1|tara:strand:- start:176 stop:526 length:351 start_codon:yes stop_codon:yes gene_type:complete
MVVVNKNGVKPFILERRTALLIFEDERYEGLEIRTKLDVDLKTYLELQALTASTDPAELTQAFTTFGDVVLNSWNLQDEDGSEVIANADGFLTIPPSFAIDILTAWSEATGSVGKV